MATGAHLLEVVGLRTVFRSTRGPVTAVNGISFHIAAGEAVGVVGESGCGKSVTALSLMRLIPDPPGRIVGGSIRFKGRNVLALGDRALRDVRGKEIAMIFEDPLTALNPMLRVERQMTEGMRLHLGPSKREARAPLRCCAWWASRPPSGASVTTRTSLVAACASAW